MKVSVARLKLPGDKETCIHGLGKKKLEKMRKLGKKRGRKGVTAAVAVGLNPSPLPTGTEILCFSYMWV